MRKEEARVLAYGLCREYVVLATYRRDFLEEFVVLETQHIFDLTEYARRTLKTFHEITYILPCTESKYSHSIRGFRVIEGSDLLNFTAKYCCLILSVLSVLCGRGLFNPPDVDLVVNVSGKCCVAGDGTWLGYVPDAGD